MDINFKSVHSESGWHEPQILDSKLCGCFHCLSNFSPSEINEWIDEPASCPRGAGKTAICPRCGVDTVLPDSIDGGLSVELLEAMQKQYCG